MAVVLRDKEDWDKNGEMQTRELGKLKALQEPWRHEKRNRAIEERARQKEGMKKNTYDERDGSFNIYTNYT